MSDSEPDSNFDAADGVERRRLREMDEKFRERLAKAIEHGKERLPGQRGDE